MLRSTWMGFVGGLYRDEEREEIEGRRCGR